MNRQFVSMIAKRFGKGFLSGLVGSMLLYSQQNPSANIFEWETWLIPALFAAVTGGLLAVEKWTQGWNPR